MRYLLFFASIFAMLPLFSQHNIAEKDHFWRKRITQRIDLTMPVNAHLGTIHNSYKGIEFEEVEGLVPSLFNGLRKGKYKAYHPETECTMEYNEVYTRMEELETAYVKAQSNIAVLPKKQSIEVVENEWTNIEVPAEEEMSLGTPVLTAQPDETSFLGRVYDKVDKKDRFLPQLKNIDFDPYLVEVQYIEDWIFDKMSSRMMYDIEYIKIIRYNSKDKSKSEVLALFKYDEVMAHLQKTLCKPSLESEESYSMREVFEGRAFKFYITNVSGKSFNSIDEAENKLQDLIEFESYLWTNEGDK